MEEYLVLLPRRSDNVIEPDNDQLPWNKASGGIGRLRFADVEVRITGIVKGSTSSMILTA